MTTALITGANRGIGLELTKVMIEHGYDVLACCRSSSETLEDTGAEVISDLDVTDDASVAKLVERLGSRKIDILVNNAGVAHFHGFNDLDFEHAKQDYDVNALGPLRITRALQDHLANGGKVIVVSSLIGSLEDNGSGGYYGYRMSKAAANMAGLNLAHQFKDREIAVVMLHPGVVATDMTGGRGKPPKEAGTQMFAAIERCKFEDSGKFLSSEGKQERW